MTFAVFIVLALGLFIAVLNVLPTAAALGFSFKPAVMYIVGAMNAWNFMFPVHELFICVGIMVGLEITIWTVQTLWKTIKLIRGHSDGA